MLPRSEPAPPALRLNLSPQSPPDEPSRSPTSYRASMSPSDSFFRGRRASVVHWITVRGHELPIVDSFDCPAPAMPWTEPARPINALELCEALHQQAPDTVPAFARRLARDVGFELCVLHNRSKRVYLGLELSQIRFAPPASFCLLPCASERALGARSPSESTAPGALGFAPEEQRNLSRGVSDEGLIAMDTFSWAACVAAFAIGEPLVPVLQEHQQPAAWVTKMFASCDADALIVLQTDDFGRAFFSHWVLDAACQKWQEANEADEKTAGRSTELATPTLDKSLEEYGAPWPALRASLGPLFIPLLEYFELSSAVRPPLGKLLHKLHSPESPHSVDSRNS